MKIVHVCLCGNFGEQYAYQDNLLPKYHKRAGNDVTIVASAYSTVKPEGGHEQEPSGVKFLTDGTKLVRLKPLLPQRINIRLRLFEGLYERLIEEEPELLFVHGLESLSYTSIINYCKRNPQTKVVVDNHADWFNGYHNKMALWWLKYISKPFISSRLHKFVSIYYGVTPARCNFLHEAFGIPNKKIKLLPFGADDDYLLINKKDELRKLTRKQYGINEEDFLIVTGGKLDKRKNIHLLAKVVAKIKHPKLKLLIFGTPSDDMKSFYENIQSDRIILAGWVPSNDVYRFFYAADLVFFPGLHSVLWEQAVACQRPSVFHRIKGFEHVNFNENCRMLDEITEESCRNIIEELYCNTKEYERLRENALSPQAFQFTYSKIAQQVIDDLNERGK